jgi:precorrin-6A/cobalt-precorrin-6A reductase
VSDAGSRGRVLLLAGTTEARQLATLLATAGVPTISSLAGRLTEPKLPVAEVRIGGFGGADGLAAWLGAQQIAAVVDATHPFATGIGAAAVQACEQTGLPLLRLERPGWTERPDDRWHWVADLSEAAQVAPKLGRRVLLAIGRQGVEAFSTVDDVWFLIRCIEPPAGDLPPHHELLLDRGPFTLAGELALIDQHGVEVIVTKDSGGSATDAKLVAARERGLPVIMVRRPSRPDTISAPDAESALAWVRSVLGVAGELPHEGDRGSAASRSR